MVISMAIFMDLIEEEVMDLSNYKDLAPKPKADCKDVEHFFHRLKEMMVAKNCTPI